MPPEIDERIEAYLGSLPERKQADLRALHHMIVAMNPGAERWFLDGKDERGKVVSNPNIGYGRQQRAYADGKVKAFYQVGISANTSGISVYLMGLADNDHLRRTYAPIIGKADVTGYCIRFRALKDIDVDVLDRAIRDGFAGPAA